MTLTNNKIDDELMKLFRKPVMITIGDTVIGEGLFINYAHKFFHYQFTITQNKSKRTKKIRIPYPFDFLAADDGRIFFDYRIKTLLNNDPDLLNIYKRVKKPNKTVFYNAVLQIKPVIDAE